jgi:hypothetical protein
VLGRIKRRYDQRVTADQVHSSPPSSMTRAAERLQAALDRWGSAARDGTVVAGLGFALLIALGVLSIGNDSHAYWTADPFHPYTQAGPSQFDAYFYSPAFVQALIPLKWLPWPAFAGLWAAGLVLVLAALTGRLLILAILLPPVFIELAVGNIHLLMAAAVVLGFRWPAAWAFILLTKVSPGVGLLWFAVRREWRSLAISLIATALVVGASFVIAPSAWFEWIQVVATRNPGTADQHAVLTWLPLAVRLPVAAALVVWGALMDRRWVLPVAVLVSMPVIWPNSFVVLLAIIPIVTSAGAPRLNPRLLASRR